MWKARPEGFCVYSGDDSATYDIMKLGGVGVISTIGNVAPARMKEIVELCAAGKWEEAAAANERLMPLMEGLFKTANPILVKEALKLGRFPGRRSSPASGQCHCRAVRRA